MNVLERKKLKFRSLKVSQFQTFRVSHFQTFRVSQFQIFFVRCRRTYIFKNMLYQSKHCCIFQGKFPFLPELESKYGGFVMVSHCTIYENVVSCTDVLEIVYFEILPYFGNYFDLVSFLICIFPALSTHYISTKFFLGPCGLALDK